MIKLKPEEKYEWELWYGRHRNRLFVDDTLINMDGYMLSNTGILIYISDNFACIIHKFDIGISPYTLIKYQKVSPPKGAQRYVNYIMAKAL